MQGTGIVDSALFPRATISFTSSNELDIGDVLNYDYIAIPSYSGDYTVTERRKDRYGYYSYKLELVDSDED